MLDTVVTRDETSGSDTSSLASGAMSVLRSRQKPRGCSWMRMSKTTSVPRDDRVRLLEEGGGRMLLETTL